MSKNIIDKIFPNYCLLCKRVGDPICTSCFKNKIITNWDTYCCVCNVRVKRGLIHEECKAQTYLDGHFFVTNYDYGVKELIMQGKYSFNYTNFEFIGKVMSKFIKLYQIDKSTIICPVPLTSKKKRARGFNQSEILANSITNFTSKSLLLKVKDVHSQAGLGGDERRQNLKDLFAINPKFTIDTSLPVLIIDDVFTTGSTLNECAKVLKTAGFKSILGYTFAKAGQS